MRKQTIERVFADAKEKHAMRYTHHRGLARVTQWVTLKFAAMNPQKLALWHSRHTHLSPFSSSFTFFISEGGFMPSLETSFLIRLRHFVPGAAALRITHSIGGDSAQPNTGLEPAKGTSCLGRPHYG